MFQDLTIKWAGVDYTIPAKKVLKAIAVIEEHVTLKELHDMTHVRQTLQLSKLAAGLGALLRWMGVKGPEGEALITDEEVYEAMFKETGGNGDPSRGSQTIVLTVMTLLAVMTPPSSFLKRQGYPAGGAGGKGKKPNKPSRTREGGQSSKPINSGSDGDTNQKNSGASTLPNFGG